MASSLKLAARLRLWAGVIVGFALIEAVRFIPGERSGGKLLRLAAESLLVFIPSLLWLRSRFPGDGTDIPERTWPMTIDFRFKKAKVILLFGLFLMTMACVQFRPGSYFVAVISLWVSWFLIASWRPGEKWGGLLTSIHILFFGLPEPASRSISQPPPAES